MSMDFEKMGYDLHIASNRNGGGAWFAIMILACFVSNLASATDVSMLPPATVPSDFRVPLAFAENHGQYDEPVKYVLRGMQGTVFFTAREVVFSFLRKNVPLPGTEDSDPNGDVVKDESPVFSRLDFRFRFEGANEQVALVGEVPLPGKINRMTGSAENWVSGIPLFKTMVYRHIYPGIDIRFHTENDNLRYEIILHDDADLERIEFVYEGVDSICLNDDGHLVISTPLGAFSEPPPRGRRGEDEVKLRFKISGSNHVKFEAIELSGLSRKE